MLFRNGFRNASTGYHIIIGMNDEDNRADVPDAQAAQLEADAPASECEAGAYAAKSKTDARGSACKADAPNARGCACKTDASDARASAPDTARQGMRLADEDYMRMAMEEAKRAAALDEVPIGAVVVYEPIDPATRRSLAEPQVIARACNLRETTRDPAGHAEFLALEQAASHLDAWRLTGCTVYVTLEPCVMCAGLMHQARVDRCVFGAADPKAGALGTLYAINKDERLNHTFEAVPGVLGDECAELLRSFFAAKRKKRTEQA